MKVSFSYYWEGIGEKGENVPMYKMPMRDKFSDVSADTLLDNGFQVPWTPSFEQWEESKETGKKIYLGSIRCVDCNGKHKTYADKAWRHANLGIK